jgi:hypothetical protein
VQPALIGFWRQHDYRSRSAGARVGQKAAGHARLQGGVDRLVKDPASVGGSTSPGDIVGNMSAPRLLGVTVENPRQVGLAWP